MAPDTFNSLDQDSLKPLVLQLLAQNNELLQQIKTLLARIAELEARSGPPPKTPTNSSLLPSSGQKANRAEALPEKKGRKGRPGVARALCPNPDQTRDIYAERCACGAALIPGYQPHVFAYDHIDLPPIKPVTTRIHVHKGNCPRCKKRVAASPPADMAPGSLFGPGIASVVTCLHACQMVSYSRMTEVLDGLFGLKVSEGAIANMLARAETPFAAQASEIAETVRPEPCHRQRRNLGAGLRENALAVDVRRSNSGVPHHRTDAGQGGADRTPRPSQTEGVALGPPRGARQSRGRTPVLSRPSHP